MKKIFTLLLSALFWLPALARDFTYTYEGQTLTYTVIDETARTVETKAGTSSEAGNSVSGSLVLPSVVMDGDVEYTLTSIGSYAFYRCTDLTSAVIPNSVTSIGSYAFRSCSGLTSVVIGNSVTSIGGSAFYGCSGLTSVEIPNSVTSISDRTFYKCSGLTSVVIGNSVTSIGGYAFFGCSGLTSVEIPNSVTSIGGSAFSGCSGLTSVVIPNSVTSIGSSAFYSCSGLTSVVIGNSVTSIGEYAFSGCISLKEVTLNAENCTSCGTWQYLVFPSTIEKLTVGDAVKSIPPYAFYGCSGLTSVVIGNSVTSIGKSAFYGCSGLTSVVIPNSVTSIGGFAFSGCSGLTSVVIGNSVTSIEGYTFEGCSGLTSVVIPNSVTSIGSYAFQNCSGLTSVDIPNSVTSIGGSAFSGCSGLTSVIIPPSVTSIDSSVFSGCGGLKKSAYPDNIKFNPFSYVVSIKYPAAGAVVEDGYVWGSDKSALYFVPLDFEGEFVIPSSVTSIGKSAFYGCSGLTSLVWPESMKKLDASYFSNSPITRLEIPASCSISGSLSKLETVILPGTDSNIKWAASVPSATKVIVRPEILSTVKTQYSSNIGPKAVTEFEEDGVAYASTSVSDPFTLIASAPASGSKVIVPEQLKYDGLTAVYPDDIFKDCPWVSHAEWYAQDIPAGAFSGASNLSYMEIGEAVKSIGSNAFANTPLTRVLSLALTPPDIADDSFNFAIDATAPLIIVPGSALEAYKAHPVWGRYALTPSTGTSVDGWKYELRGDNATLRVIGITDGLAASTSLSFPDSIVYHADGKTYPVTELSAGIFKDVTPKAETINVHSGIKTIAAGAFENLTTVKSITFEDGDESLAIGEDNLGNLWKNLESVVIGRNITNIGDVAVFGSTRTKLKTLIFTDSVTTIPARLFNSARTTVGPTFGKNLVTIGMEAFTGSQRMASVEFPASLKEIGDGAFKDCTALNSVTFSGHLDRIGASAFEGDYKIKAIDMQVDNIEQYAFKDCTALKSAKVKAKSIANSSFLNNSALDSVDISADMIEESAFTNLIALKKANIKANTISEKAFDGATALETITIESLGNLDVKTNAIAGTSANSIYVHGDGRVQQDAFSTTGTVGTLTLDVTTVNGAGISVIDNLVFGDNVVTVGGFSGESLSGGRTINNITFGTGIKSVGKRAFGSCNGFTRLEFPSVDGAQAEIILNESAFSGCSALTSIELGNRMKSVSNGCFSGCPLVDPGLGSSVQSIGSGNFESASGTLSIPASVTWFDADGNNSSTVTKLIFEDGESTISCGDKIFTGKQVYIGRPTSSLRLSGCDIEFSDNKALNLTWGGTIFTKGNTLKIGGAVKQFNGRMSIASGGKSLSKLEICEGVESIGTGALLIPTAQESLTLPASLKTVASNAFNDFSGESALNQVIFSDGNGEIELDGNIFGSYGAKNKNIKELYLGKNVKYTVSEIGGPLAASIPGIEKAIVGDGIKELNAYTFKDCEALTNAVIPDGLEHVGKSAFENCSGLTVLSMSENLKTIDDNAYNGCTGLQRVVARSLIPAESASGSPKVFPEYITENVPLYVPDAVIDDYLDSDVFWLFGNIEGSGEAVADSVVVDDEATKDKNDGEEIDLAFSQPGQLFWLIVKKIYNAITGHNAPARIVAAKAPEAGADADTDAAAAAEFYWFSTNPEVASVTQEGQVLIHKEEPVEIWAIALDGSDKKAIFEINGLTFDINNDGVIDILDVELMINAVHTPDVIPFSKAKLDYNKNSEIDMFDVEILINKVHETK